MSRMIPADAVSVEPKNREAALSLAEAIFRLPARDAGREPLAAGRLLARSLYIVYTMQTEMGNFL